MRLQKLLYVLLLAICFTSCQTLVKAYFGIKDPKYAVENSKRLEYYKPFYENKEHETQILTVADEASFIKAFEAVSFPSIFLHNKENGSLYILNCFEDISYDVENFNNGLTDKMDIAKREDFDAARSIIEQGVASFSSNIGMGNGTWDVYMVHGTFMGKKIRNRMLPVTAIKGLNKMVILDISVNKQEKQTH